MDPVALADNGPVGLPQHSDGRNLSVTQENAAPSKPRDWSPMGWTGPRVPQYCSDGRDSRLSIRWR